MLCLFWWFNLVICSMVFILAIFNIRVGNSVIAIQHQQKQEYKHKFQRDQCDEDKEQPNDFEKSGNSDAPVTCIDDTVAIEQKKEFDEGINSATQRERSWTWKTLYFITFFALIVVYPSQFIRTFHSFAHQGSLFQIIHVPPITPAVQQGVDEAFVAVESGKNYGNCSSVTEVWMREYDESKYKSIKFETVDKTYRKEY